MNDFTSTVREHYEALPYPPRNPEDEKSSFLSTTLDYLPQIVHHCYQGKRNVNTLRHVLVAGGGTGDAAIYLAEQLNTFGGQLVYLDLSASSMAIAQARAAARGLDNIQWVHGSLLDLPGMGLGPFDYINCSGVLHHLADPDEGLAALKSVLHPEGCMGLMVYAKYGRTGVYQMQETLRLINRNQDSMDVRLRLARGVLAGLPESNWFQKGRDLFRTDLTAYGDAGIYDLLLHAQDRAYSFPELCQWTGQAGLHIRLSGGRGGESRYRPESYLADADCLAAISQLAREEQFAIGELLAGNIIKHEFYATRAPDSGAQFGDVADIPFFAGTFGLAGPALADYIGANPKSEINVNIQTGTIKFTPLHYTQSIFKYLDGKRPFSEIFALVRKEKRFKGKGPTDQALLEDFRPVFEAFNGFEMLLLRAASTDWKAVDDINALFRRYQEAQGKA